MQAVDVVSTSWSLTPSMIPTPAVGLNGYTLLDIDPAPILIVVPIKGSCTVWKTVTGTVIGASIVHWFYSPNHHKRCLEAASSMGRHCRGFQHCRGPGRPAGPVLGACLHCCWNAQSMAEAGCVGAPAFQPNQQAFNVCLLAQ
ncbi:hypothetical protein [Leptolyngbya sp. 7M]|uniref:hypothetical protein n=1 Tax=Leptolyngbya sp. 7M TaxID=2812896 RepID=UPI001B8B4CE8|nr:hypothetical protein [Leptolyngbya sp. 7M]QYO63740.1 hypothetical protein JVX88_28425 [Leptolyngbya sp. 7M]